LAVDKDISKILKDWNYDPANISARWIEAEDGRRLVQLRLDLGLFQMEVTGRPDGSRPRGADSLLDYYNTLLMNAKEDDPALVLDFDACAELQQESMQFYYRYLSFYALHCLDGVIDDTAHNLSVIDLVSEFAEDDDLAWQFLQFFPYVRMMNARARAEQAVEHKRFEEAVRVLEEGLEDIRSFWNEHGDFEMGVESHEVELLTGLLRQVMDKKPKSKSDKLREELEDAISHENYEKAATLRDQLNMIQKASMKHHPLR
jgi:hypothetical protein